jgi:ArsR family transcriptional regulator
MMTAATSTSCVSLSPLSLFKCLAEETRLKTLLMLCVKDELCVCDLTDALNLSQPKISRHLADLRKCGLVADDRRGKWVYYRLNPALPAWAKEVIHLSATNNADYISDALSNLKCDADC